MTQKIENSEKGENSQEKSIPEEETLSVGDKARKSEKQEVQERKVFSKGAYGIVSEGEKNISDEEIGSFSDFLSSSIWQTKARGTMLKKSNQAGKIFEIDGIFIEKRKIAFSRYGLFIIGLAKNLSLETSQKLQKLCKQEKALFIQIEMIFYDEESKNSNIDSCLRRNDKKNIWKSGYYKKFIPPYTAVIDLSKTEEEILTNMKPKGRYNIRLAEKKGVTCKIVEKTDENIKVFFSLMQETCSRDNFAGNTIMYYKTFLDEIKESELILAYFEGKAIAGGIFTFSENIALYYYGASSNAERKLMAPYLLQWTAILEAKKRGGKIYDFLGIASPDEKNSPLAGVSDFKKKLSKDMRKVSESFICIENKILYFFIMLLKKIRK